jgi:hypothetical protein
VFELGTVVAVAIFMLGVTFQLGGYAARIASLESWRNEQRQHHTDNLKALEGIRVELAGLRRD